MPKILRLAKLAKQINGENLLYNGNFDVWQRGLSFNEPGFTADRWFVSMYTNELDANENTIVAKKVLSGGDIDNNSYAIRLENAVSEEYYYLSQVIPTENVLPHQGETATISYYARTPDNSFSGLLYSAMYYTPYADNAIKEKTLIGDSAITGSISSGWTQLTKTFTIPSNAQSLVFEIQPHDLNLPSGTKLDITQTKFEIGSQASPLMPLSYSDELSRCERFYQKIAYATPIPNNNPNFSLTIPVKQRLKNQKLSKIKNFRDASRNLVDKTLSILDNNTIVVNGRTANSAANIDLSDLVIEAEIYPVDKPEAPTNIISITGVIESGLAIQWSGSYDNGSPINYYVIDYGTTESNLDESTLIDISGNHPSGTPTSGYISGLLENAQYYFQITAYNGFGSTSTNILSHYFDQYPDPSAVINLTAAHGDNNTNLSWTSYPGSPIPGLYIIDRDIVDTFDSSYLSTKRVLNRTFGSNARYSNSYSFDRFDNSQSGNYYFRVSTVLNNTTGVSDTISIARGTPDKINNVLTTSNTNSINIGWAKPSSNGSAVTGYVVQYSYDSGNINNGTTIFSVNTNTLVNSLSANVELFLRVAGLNEFGTGIWSDTTSETPNRVPGTPSSPRNLVAYWPEGGWWRTTDLDINWRQSKDLSDYVAYTDYNYNDTNYSWPISTAKIDWDSPVDNGGQNISYYTIVADTSNNYDSNNLKTYNTQFFRQTSALLINELLTTSTGTWYIKCAAINPSGTGSYATTTLFTDTPKLIYYISGSSSFAYQTQRFVDMPNGTFNYAKSYLVNSCGLPLLSGYALTGIGGGLPTTKNSYTSLFPDIKSDNYSNPFETYVSNIPAGKNFSIKPVWFNAAGSGAMELPSNGDNAQTPYSPANDFRALSYTLYSANQSTRPSITLRSAQSWSSSIGVGSFSGVFYNGHPTTGTIINNTFGSNNYFTTPVSTNSTLLRLPTPTFSSIPTQLWLKGNVILTLNNGNRYISQDQPILMWNRTVSVPAKPFIHTHSSTYGSTLYFHHASYGSSSLRGGDSLDNITYKVYIEDLKQHAQPLNKNAYYTTVTKSSLTGGLNRYGYQQIIAEVSNSSYTVSSSVSQIFFGYLSSYFIPKFYYAQASARLTVLPASNRIGSSRLVSGSTTMIPSNIRLSINPSVRSVIDNTIPSAFISNRTVSNPYIDLVASGRSTTNTVLTTTLYRGLSSIYSMNSAYNYLDRFNFLLRSVSAYSSVLDTLNCFIVPQYTNFTIANDTRKINCYLVYCGSVSIGWLITIA